MENKTTAAQKTFFSYSRTDGQEHALKLATDLRNAGANVWIDQLDIEPGKLWDLEVEKALNAADSVLFIATEKSTTSNNVLNEVYYALDENKKVIPVVFHDCRIPFQLRRLQRIDFTADYNIAFERLIKALDVKNTGLAATQTAEIQTEQPLTSINANGENPVKSPQTKTFNSKKQSESVDHQAKEQQIVKEQRENLNSSTPASNLLFEEKKNEREKTKKRLLWGIGIVAAVVLLLVLLHNTPGINDTVSSPQDSMATTNITTVDSSSTNVPNGANENQPVTTDSASLYQGSGDTSAQYR